MVSLGQLALFCFLLRVGGVTADFELTTLSTSRIEVTWDDDTVSGLTGFTIELDNEIKYNGGNTSGSHTLTDLDAGTLYTVVIKTDDGANITTLQKSATTVPNAPTNLQATATVDSLTPTWEAPTSGGVATYTVTLNDGATVKETTPGVIGTTTTFNNGLTAGKEYTILVTSVIGGQNSDPLQGNFYTKPNSVSGLVIDSLTTTSLKVKWVAPGGVLTGYIVTLDDSSGSEETKTPGEDKTSAEFTGLAAGKQYTIGVVTVSGSARSSVAEGQFYTIPISVTDLALQSRTTSSLVVEWTAPSGIWTGYTVQLVDVVGGHMQTKSPLKEATSVGFTVLEAGTQYTVRVFTLSGGQRSVKMEGKFYTIPSSVDGLAIESRTTTSVVVKWDTPSGMMSGYRVTLDDGSGTVQTKLPSEVDTSVVFTGLRAATQYTVQAFTLSGGLESALAEIKFYTMPNSATNLQVTATVDSLKPTWVAPAAGGDVTYTATLKDGDQIKETKEGITETTTTFNSGLTAGKEYTILVISVIGGQNSDPLQRNFYTKPNVPLLIQAPGMRVEMLAVIWEAPSSGLVEKYTVKLKDIPGTSQDVMVSSARRTQFTGLIAGKLYTVVVAAVSGVLGSGGQKSDDAEGQFYTKPNAPTNLIVSTRSGSTLTVTWVAGADENTGFAVKLQGQDEHPVSAGTKGSHEFTGLMAGREYTVVVVTTSGDQRSESLAGKFHTTPSDPKNLVVPARTVSTLTVTWDAGDGDNTGFSASLQGGTQHPVIKGSTGTWTFPSLTAGQEYTVVVVTKSGGQTSNSVTGKFRTEPNKPMDLVVSARTVSTLTVTWGAGAGEKSEFVIKLEGGEEHTVTGGATGSWQFTKLTAGREYTVAVVTKSGAQSSVALTGKFRTKPNTPENLTAIERTTKTLTVTWSAGGGELSGFTVSREGGEVKLIGMSDPRQHKFTGLKPGTKYTVDVVSRSADQTSAAMTQDFHTMPSEVRDLSIESRGRSYFNLKWTKPEGKYSGFRITYAMPGQTTTQIDIADVLQKEITDLEAGKEYTVYVYTIRGTDKSTGSTIKITTEPATVAEIVLVGRSPTSLKVSWEEPVGTGLTHYHLWIHQNDSGLTLPIKVNKADTLAYTFNNLKPGQSYNITISVLSAQVSSQQVSRYLTTNPLPPTGLVLTTMSTNSIKVTWQYDSDASFSTKWTVKYKVVGDTATDEVSTNDVRQHEKTISNLASGRKYAISVFGVTTGAVISLTSADGQATVRPLAVTELGATATDSSSVALTWTPDAGSQQDSYQIWHHGSSQATGWSSVITSTDPEKSVSNLFPGDTYTFEVKAVSGTELSSGETATAVLYPLPPTDLTVTEWTVNSVHISWQYDSSKSYSLKWRVDYTEKDTINTETIVKNVDEREVTLPGLKSGLTYTIEVFAITTGDVVSQTAAEIEATAKPLSVTAVTAVASDHSTVEVSWTPDGDSHQSSYELKYKDVTKETDWSEVVSLTAEMKTVTGLFPGDKYTFDVRAVSNLQTSAAKTATAVLYPLPPTGLAVATSFTTTHSVTVVWTYDHTRSHCVKWTVKYTVKDLSIEKTRDTNSAKALLMEIPELVAGQVYMVTVYGVTVEGVVSLEAAHVSATVKPEITTILTEKDTTDTDSVVVSYTAETGDGVFDHYFFSINDRDTTTVSKGKDVTSRTVQFDRLDGGTLYTVTAWSMSGSEKSRDINTLVRTVPNKPVLQCTVEQDAITIAITKGAGIANKFSFVCGNCNDTSQHDEGIDTLRYTNLVPYTWYTFFATAIADSEANYRKESAEAKLTCQTNEGHPRAVWDLQVTYNTPLQLQLSWTEPAVKNGALVKYTVAYDGTYFGQRENIPDEVTKTITVNDVSKASYVRNITGLKHGYTYTFVVRAYNTLEGIGSSFHYSLPFIGPATDMPLSEAKPRVINNDKIAVKEDQFQMVFKNPFSDRYGAVVSYSVIVTTRQNDAALTNEHMPYWSRIQRSGDTVFSYVAIAKCARFFTAGDTCWRAGTVKRAADAQSVVMTIGGDDTCNEDQDVACNGALSSSTTYYVKLRAYDDGGKYTDTPLSEPIETASSSMPWGAIGGGIGAAVLVIIIIVIVIVLLKRRGFSVKKARPIGDTFIDPLRGSFGKQKLDTSYRVKLVDFPAHWKKMNADSHLLFAMAYEDLKPIGCKQPQTVAELPVNRSKNRFTNILPYDRTRIKLMSGGEEDEGTDYINGNWMPGYNSKREYAVAQGPLPGTKEDMWRMIWEHNVRAIVMLTRCVEKGREKCDHYWPVDNQPMYYGDLRVEIHSENKTVDWVVTMMKVSMGSQSRNITHYHYIAWPDFGVPDNPQSLIGFVRLVRRSLEPTGGPIVVHCSAGVGRSGTFIVLDRLLQHIEEHDWVDIYNMVYEMRLYRNMMVQTEAQYVCIHNCLLCVLEGHEDPDEDGEENDAYEDDDGYVMKT